MANTNDTIANLQEIHDFLIDLAIKAGKVITSSIPRIDSTGSKKNSGYTFSYHRPECGRSRKKGKRTAQEQRRARKLKERRQHVDGCG
jgi:hypothetical protein